MMKKLYDKPSMTVYELTYKPQMLVGSPNDYPGSFGQATDLPGIPEDMNKLTHIS